MNSDTNEQSESEDEDEDEEIIVYYRPLNENFDRTISISKIAVTFIISLHIFDLFGILSNIFLKNESSSGIDIKLPLNFIFVFTIPIIAWCLSIPFYFIKDWKFKFQMTIHGFWIWSFILMVFEGYTRKIYNSHKDELSNESRLFMNAPGFSARHRDENYRDRNRPSWRTLKFWSNTPIPDISVTTNEKYKLPNTVGEFYQKFKKLIPFIWPCGRENLSLQILIILCVIILIIGRVVNVFVPIQYKRIINSFGNLSKGGLGVYFGKEAGDDTPASVPYKDYFCLYS
ncbi:hypothetical protein BCR36DRAFT_375815 [Piromyces finnis]|uniref:Uncharacterized protein n=1 Tax=Piromyces finnis TaxID=1754191 RepID=A0A1Y1UCU2_9FUNG|nr:hypothetical protein BCR36DRAFT_375815 [Piromyces finnis]|eukprot:ORX35819.1 hypothetical protein BCR36DRAFT_375815 [Piromyces finnis]